jgi:predicted nucleotidyltransferase
MSNGLSRRLTLGFKILDEIPSILRPLADDTVACYRRHHSDLRSVYVIGSVAVGEWTEGVSDLDVVGVVEHEFTPADDAARRGELLKLGKFWPQVSFINNSALSLAALHREKPEAMIVGRAPIIAVTGLHVWGDKLDFQYYIPSVEEMARERAARAKILIGRYRSGVINEPFRSNPRLLARSSAKAAIRVLSGITILRGAVFYTSPEKTVVMIAEFAPEATPLARQALSIINGTSSEPCDAMDIAEQAIELFYSLYPASSSESTPA